MAGGWVSSERVLPPGWQRLRLRILRRDGYRCQMRLPSGAVCGEMASDVDHIVPGGDHRPENLRALCRECHARKSSAEGNAARQRRRRPSEGHPGGCAV